MQQARSYAWSLEMTATTTVMSAKTREDVSSLVYKPPITQDAGNGKKTQRVDTPSPPRIRDGA